MHSLCVFWLFFQKSLFTENYFLIAAINLATRGPLYTCLVYICYRSIFSCFKKCSFVFQLSSVRILWAFKGRPSEPKINQKSDKNTGFWPGFWKNQPLKYKGSFIFWPIFLKICMKVALRNAKQVVGVDFWIFCFCAIYSTKTPKICHFCDFCSFDAL